MTTVVARRSTMTMAADTRSSYHNRRVHKLHVLPDQSVVAMAGELFVILQAVAWLAGLGEKPNIVADHRSNDCTTLEMLRLYPDGRLTYCQDLTIEHEVVEDHMAIGSGGNYAMGALDAGASIEDAVRIACRRDPNSAEPIDLHTVERA